MVKKIEILYLNQYSSIDFHDEKQETLKSAYNRFHREVIKNKISITY